MLGRILLVVVGPGFGWLSDHVSDRAAFGALAGVTLLLAAAAAVLHRRARTGPIAATL
jgi:F0F1-type ATP synthase assembly protein I